MHGFTLIEVTIVILIITLLISIALKYSFINNEVLELKNATYSLSSYLGQLKDISFSRKNVDGYATDQSACAYGLKISSSSYIAKAFVTSTRADCDKIASNTPAEFQDGNIYITKNFDLVTTSDYYNIINEQFNNIKISIATSANENCEPFPGDLLEINDSILISFYNPFGDFIVINDSNEKIFNSREIGVNQSVYVCLKLKSSINNEERLIILNKLGQIKTVLFK
ncbi:MAG: hypothetical protein KatS3mg097_266 [Candidatus Parcubacteria bacterium]|nr:MAG: hypothetical protein KatS3mg097_266 [Candidatus Parcubacteria bacterium]